MTLQRVAPAEGRPSPWTRRGRAFAAIALALQAGVALAIDFGPLVLRRESPQRWVAHLRLSDSTPLEANQLSIRLAHPDAYRALGLRYEPALAAAAVSTQPTMDSGLTVSIQPLPSATADQRPLDIVLIVFEGIKLYTRHYRVDLQGQRTEFAGVDPGDLSSPTAVAAPRGAPSPAPSPAVVTTVATAAAPAAAAEPAASEAAALAEVARALSQWSQAWASRNVDAYVSAYEADFHGALGSRAAWQSQRRERILAKRQIEVELSDVKVSLQGSQAEVRFVQRYRGDELRQTIKKRLRLARHDGGWLIREEAAL